jgi:hypothetical protein
MGRGREERGVGLGQGVGVWIKRGGGCKSRKECKL